MADLTKIHLLIEVMGAPVGLVALEQLAQSESELVEGIEVPTKVTMFTTFLTSSKGAPLIPLEVSVEFTPGWEGH